MRLEEKEALEAAEKLKDFCTGRNCLGCIFDIVYADCMLCDDEPCEWDTDGIGDEQDGCWMDNTDKYGKPNPHQVISWMPMPDAYEPPKKE